MPKISYIPAEHVKYRSTFVSALKAYHEKTGKVLSSELLLLRLEKCRSLDDIITILWQQIPGIGPSEIDHRSLARWLNPTVNVINSYSAAIHWAIGLAHTPAMLIFTAIGVLLSADTKAVSAARGALFEIFERMRNIFGQLETCINIPTNAGMMDAIIKVLTDVLSILAIMTKEVNQTRTKTFLKKLVGRKDIEDAIQRLEKVTAVEAQIAAAEAPNGLHVVGDKVVMFDRKRMKSIRETQQGTDVRAKGTRNKASVKKQGRYMATNFHAVAAEGSKAVHGVSDNGRAEELQGAWNRARISNEESAKRDFVVRTVDVKNMSPSTESNSAYLRWGLSGSSATEWFSLHHSSIMERYSSRHPSNPSTTEWHSARDSSIVSRCEDYRDFDSHTLLDYAASNADLTQLISQQGVDINSRDSRGRTALHQALIEYPLADDKVLNIIKVLLDHGADVGAQDERLYTPLHLAANEGKYAVVQLLLECGASIHARDTSSSTPLHHASLRGYPDVIQLLLERGADIEAQNYENSTPLHLAAEKGEVAATQTLLEHGARIHTRDMDSCTPLHRASWYGHPYVIKLLVEHGADIEAQGRDNDTPLHHAACQGKVRAVQELLKHRVTIDVRSKYLWSPLHFASSYGHPDVIQFLLEQGAEIEAQTRGGDTPLHLAACQEKVAAVQMLLAYHAMVHAWNDDDLTPIELASEMGHSDVAQLLRIADGEALLG